MSSRDEQQEEYNLLRIEALEKKIRELEIKLELENEKQTNNCNRVRNSSK
mgnify:CR=1 FL=1